jgi:hypothetical protein
MNNFNKKIIPYLICLSAICACLFSATVTNAYSTVFFENQNQNIRKGDTFTIDFRISSFDEAINTISGVIIYDKSKLQINDVEFDNSLLSLWIKEPAFDNSKGELSLIGGIPNGFKGEAGLILSINFLAKQNGISNLDFQDIFYVLANDGDGKNMNSYLKPLTIKVVNQPIIIVIFVIFSLCIIGILGIIYNRLRSNKLPPK